MNDRTKSYAPRRAIVALAFIGKDAIPALSAQPANTNAPNRHDVAMVFGNPLFRADFAPVAPLLVRCLDDKDQEVAVAAIMSLGRMAEHNQAPAHLVMSALTNCLHANTSEAIRARAAWTLGQYNIQARGAVPALLQSMTDTNLLVRIHSTNALLLIAPEALTNAVAK